MVKSIFRSATALQTVQWQVVSSFYSLGGKISPRHNIRLDFRTGTVTRHCVWESSLQGKMGCKKFCGLECRKKGEGVVGVKSLHT